MDIADIIPPALLETSLAEPLASLNRIYERIEKEQAAWIEATPYRCPPGCGTCCEGFEPDLLDVEALFLAAWMLRHAPEGFSFAEGNQARKGCVLAKREGDYHCTVYGGRPLICRLFAYSGDRGKDGQPRFSPCKHMAVEGKRALNAEELTARYRMLPPVMGDLAGEASLLMPDSAGATVPLREALPRAVSRLRFLLAMQNGSAFSDAGPADSSPVKQP